jgi:hypothetical protein
MVLVSHHANIALKVTGSLGDASLQEAIYTPVLVLTGAGHLAAVQDAPLIVKAKKNADKLNAYILQKAHRLGSGCMACACCARPEDS